LYYSGKFTNFTCVLTKESACQSVESDASGKVCRSDGKSFAKQFATKYKILFVETTQVVVISQFL